MGIWFDSAWFSGGSGGGGGSTVVIIGSFATYGDLPAASLNADKFAHVETSTGIYLINRKQKGYYRSDGLTWIKSELDEEALDALTNHLSQYDHASIAEKIKNIQNVVIVQTNPGPGQFSSITAALASITTNSSTNPFVISVGPGVYIEDTITTKPYVDIIGHGPERTILQVDSTAKDVIHISDNNVFIHGMTISGASDAGKAGVSYTGTVAATSVYLDTIRFKSNNIHVLNKPNGVGVTITVQNSTIAAGSFANAFVSQQTGGGQSTIFLKSCSFLITGAITSLALADGANTNILATGTNFRSISIGDCFVAQDAGRLQLVGCSVAGWTRGIYMPNIGSSTVITAHGMNFDANTQDLVIEHTSATGVIEGPIDITKIDINDSCSVFIPFKDPRIIRVNKSGGDFSTITDALAFITDNSSSNRYLIDLGPGTYIEDTITMKPYVYLQGKGNEITIIQVDTATKKVIIGADHSGIISCGITGASGSGGIGVYHEGSGTFTPFLVRDCYFMNNETNAKAHGAAAVTILQVDQCRTGGTTNFTNGFICTNVSSIPTQLVVTNSIHQDVINPGCTLYAKATGVGTGLVLDNVLARNYPSASSTFVSVEDGAEVRMLAVSIRGFGKSIHAINSGSAPKIFAQGININESVTDDILIEHTGTTGNYFGTYTVDKVSIASGSNFHIANKDLNIITVAKRGGDFSSIAAACDFITDADPATNPYLILVGPGVFSEPEINLKTGISIRGASIESTIIEPDANNHNVVNMATATELSFLTIRGAGSGYIGVMCDDLGDFAQLHKVSLIDNDTHIKLRSVTQDSYLYLEYVDINGVYTNGLYIESTNGFLAHTNAENWYTFNDAANTGNDHFVTGTNAFLYVQLSIAKGSTLNTGYRIENGAYLRGSDIKVEDTNYAIYLPNIGAGQHLHCFGIQTVNSTTNNFKIDHTGADGFLDGSADVTKISVVAGAMVKLNIIDNDPTSSIGSAVVGDIYQGESISEIQNISKIARESFTPGVSHPVPAILSQGTNPLDVDVAAGEGFVATLAEQERVVSWIASTLTVPDNSKYYVTVNSSGTLQLESSLPLVPSQRIILGYVISLGGILLVISNSYDEGSHSPALITRRLRTVNGAQFAAGSLVTENLSTDRAIDITPGEYYDGTKQFLPSGGTAVSFRELYQDGSGGTTLGSIATQVSNTQYDDGSGTLASIPSNKYAKHVVLLCGEGTEESYFLVYGQDTYTTLLEAQTAALPTFPSFVDESLVQIASIIVQEGNANFAETPADIRPFPSNSRAANTAITDHGALTGLADNDHPQYLLRAGGAAMTANIDMGGYTLTNIGSALPGTTTAAVVTQTPDQANAEGVSADKARADHVHNIPTATPVSISTSNQQGTASSFSRSDHVHNHGNLGGGSTHSAATTSVNGFMSAADKTKLDLVSSAELGYVSGVTSAIQTQLNAKAANGANTDITSVLLNQTGLVVKGATSFGLIIKPDETLTANRTLSIITGNADRTLTITGAASISGTHTGTSSGSNTGDQTITLTGDVTGSGTSSFVATIAANAVTNSKLAQVATLTIKGRITGGTGNLEDLTVTQVTSMLNAFTGDSGSGGVKGLVPAPASGDATKFLRGDGTWADNASGSVTTVSVTSANGFGGSVANPSSTPAITITTSITGMLKGNGTAISAATAGTDYSAGTSGLATGILKSTTGSGALSIATAGSDYEVPLTFSTGLTRSINTITVNTIQNISRLSNLSSNGVVTTSGGDGTLGVTSTTGSGNVVLASGPVLSTPTLGVATVTSVNKLTITTPATSATLTIADGKTLSVSNTVSFSGTDGSTVAFGAGGTILYVGPRVQAVTSSATVTPDANANDLVVITAQAAGLTLANPTGTPVQGQKLVIRIKDNGTARSIAFGANYRALGNALPTTTVISKTLYLGLIYNSTDTKWDLVALAQEA